MADNATLAGSPHLSDIFQDLFERYSNESRNIGIGVAIFVVLLTLLIIFLGRRKNSRRSVLIMGVCEAGKTLTFAQLVHKQQKRTQMSFKENVGVFKDPKKAALTIVDLPGQERLRWRLFEEYRSSARCVLFVIDSSTIQKDIKDVAECLYTILADPVISSNKPRLLIACNKQDLTFAKGATVVQTLLEKELNLLRKTQTAALGSTDGDGDKTSAPREIGKKGEDFQFSHLPKRMRVAFVECRATAASDSSLNLDPVRDYLATKVA